MFSKVFLGLALAVATVFAGVGMAERSSVPAESRPPSCCAVAAQSGDKTDCCKKNLACCEKGKTRACCVATARTGCCAKGLKCCETTSACCSSVQECCRQGEACCNEGKACCGKQQ